MSEENGLKTLKDLEISDEVKQSIINGGAINPVSTVSVADLREEAIKWVLYIFSDDFKNSKMKLTLDEKYKVGSWIMHFFDIDTEELK